nr:hypothetical protein [Bacteroidales bacterium]
WVAQVVKNNPYYAMNVLTHYIENLTPAQVAQVFTSYNAMIDPQAKADLLDSLAKILPEQSLTAEDLNNFIDTVTLPTALDVYGHVQEMNTDIKEGLKTWVAQVVKNNPYYAMNVLTHYIENLTPAQVAQVFTSYNEMIDPQAKADLLDSLADIIKENPDIAYNVLNHYIDNVTMTQALDVYGHVQEMNTDVKEGLKTWVAQVVKNNEYYVLNVLDYYLGNTTPSASVTAAIDTYIANHIPTETSKKFTATAAQTSFPLTVDGEASTPNSNYLVRMYINGIMVGDSATGVVTVNGTTVTYVPAQNGNTSLKAGDTVIISWFK